MAGRYLSWAIDAQEDDVREVFLSQIHPLLVEDEISETLAGVSSPEDDWLAGHDSDDDDDDDDFLEAVRRQCPSGSIAFRHEDGLWQGALDGDQLGVEAQLLSIKEPTVDDDGLCFDDDKKAEDGPGVDRAVAVDGRSLDHFEDPSELWSDCVEAGEQSLEPMDCLKPGSPAQPCSLAPEAVEEVTIVPELPFPDDSPPEDCSWRDFIQDPVEQSAPVEAGDTSPDVPCAAQCEQGQDVLPDIPPRDSCPASLPDVCNEDSSSGVFSEDSSAGLSSPRDFLEDPSLDEFPPTDSALKDPSLEGIPSRDTPREDSSFEDASLVDSSQEDSCSSFELQEGVSLDGNVSQELPPEQPAKLPAPAPTFSLNLTPVGATLSARLCVTPVMGASNMYVPAPVYLMLVPDGSGAGPQQAAPAPPLDWKPDARRSPSPSQPSLPGDAWDTMRELVPTPPRRQVARRQASIRCGPPQRTYGGIQRPAAVPPPRSKQATPSQLLYQDLSRSRGKTFTQSFTQTILKKGATMASQGDHPGDAAREMVDLTAPKGRWMRRRSKKVDLPKKLTRCGRCELCSKEFKRLDKHMLIHLQLRPHECGVCGTRFTQSEHLKRHQQQHSETMDPLRKCLCPECGKVLSRRDKLKDHMNYAHGPGSKSLDSE